MHIKARILLPIYFIFMAVASFLCPAIGLQLMDDERKCEEERKRARRGSTGESLRR
jgi:hypothetical protein